MMSDCKSPGCTATVPGSESPSAVDPRVCESTMGEKLLLETKEQDQEDLALICWGCFYVLS